MAYKYLLARSGATGGGKAGITPAVIQDVVATWKDGWRAPISFDYHPGDFGADVDEASGKTIHPKAGDVVRVWAKAGYTELWGEITWLAPVESAIAEGWFQDRSVGIAVDHSGRFYLHHVALLGGLPPAIKGMPALDTLGNLPTALFRDPSGASASLDGVMLYSTGVFKKIGRGTPSPLAPPRRLVARGLYRRSRNPMYVAYVTVALGEALFFGRTVLLIYAAAMFLALHLLIVLHEEPELRQRFGEDYETYRKTVPRWL